MPILAAAISPFNPNFNMVVPPGTLTAATLQQMEGLVSIQALMISYIDDFYLMMVITTLRYAAGIVAEKSPTARDGPRSKPRLRMIDFPA